MADRQTARETAQNLMQTKQLAAAEANVLMVQIEGVRIVSGKIPAEVRKALNAAVKAGELGHIKKEGLRPEAYHHKNARARALEERNRIFNESVAKLKTIFA